MSDSPQMLWLAAATMAAVGASLALCGLRRRAVRGRRFWTAAIASATVGVAGAAGGSAPWLAAVLLLQWPLLTLIGLRRFHARLHTSAALPLSERADWWCLALCTTLATTASIWPAPVAPAGVLPALAGAAAHLYAAALLLRTAAQRPARPLRTLGLAVGLGAVAAPAALATGAGALGLQAAATALGAVVAGFALLTLVAERNESLLRESHRRLRTLANLDMLTQVPNRRHFHDLATRALQKDGPGSATLLMFDVDHFKRINDGYGHAAGDLALRLVAASVQAHLRAQDIAGRHGGDEFALLLRDTPVSAAGHVAERIVRRLQADAASAALPPLSLSFGLVQLRPGESLADALRRADQALYEAKRQGRSCAVMADGDEEQPVFSESQRLGLTPC